MGQFDTHGGYFAPKDYFRVNTGGSHEENPNGGVQVGVDPQGVPNMLEEGEPVYKDYVYSDNIIADKKFLEENHLPVKYAGKLYSKIADAFVDEAEERPNDPISNGGLNAMLLRLADAQEAQKQAKEQEELEEQLSQLSPDELTELESMLNEQEQPEVQQEEMMGPAETIPEEMTMQQPVEQPMMENGGFMKRYDIGGSLDDDPRKRAEEAMLEAQQARSQRDAEIAAMNAEYEANRATEAERAANERKLATYRRRVKRDQKTLDRLLSGAENVYPADRASYKNLLEKQYGLIDYNKKKLSELEAALSNKPVSTESVSDSVSVAPIARTDRSEWTDEVAAPRGGKSRVIKALGGQINRFDLGGPEKGYWRPGGMWTGLREIPQFTAASPVLVADPNAVQLPYSLVVAEGPRHDELTGRIVADESIINPRYRKYNRTPGYIDDSLFDVELAPMESVPDYVPSSPTNEEIDGLINGSSSVGNSPFPVRFDQPIRDTFETWKYRRRMGDELEPGPLDVSIEPAQNPYVKQGERTLFPGRTLGVTKPTSSDNTGSHSVIDNQYRPLPTWSRYAKATGAGLLGLYDLFQQPDKYRFPRVNPVLPEGSVNYQPLVYNPLDWMIPYNAQVAQTNASLRALTGSGPSLGSNVIGLDSRASQAYGQGMNDTWTANANQRNQVIAGNNQSEGQRASFDYGISGARANILNNADQQQFMRDMYEQRFNNESESEKYAALSNQINTGLDALAGIGTENFRMNQTNTNTGLEGYQVLPDGRGGYKLVRVDKCGGTLLKKYKK